MAKDIENLKTRALLIKNATESGENTADRVGGLLHDMIKYDENQDEIINNIEVNELKSPLSEINKIGAPSKDNQVILYKDSQWQYTDAGSGGGGGGDVSKLKIDSYFLNYTHGQKPATPSTTDYVAASNTFVDGNNTWKNSNDNPGENQDTWAIWAFFNNGSCTSISGPTLIYNSEAGGSNGEDGEDIEWIYTQSEVIFDDTTMLQLTHALYSYVGNSRIETTVEIGGRTWTNHPQGIDTIFKYEYAALRHSTNDEYGNRIWGQIGFTGPLLWSAYGKKGLDGDGVEYIFSVTNNASTPEVDPSTWNPSSYDNWQDNEFIPEMYRDIWFDNPQELIQGQYQWMSIRKKQIPSNGDGVTALWGAYSSPKLWNYYAQDGIAEGYQVDLTNERMPVGTTFEGKASDYSNSCGVKAYHNGHFMYYKEVSDPGDNDETYNQLSENEFTYKIGTITRSDAPGVAASGISAEKNSETVIATITEVTDFSNVNAYIPIIIYLPNKTYREVTITMFGVAVGEAGQTIDLYTNAAAIAMDYYGQNAYPDKLELGVKIGKGSAINLYYSKGTSTGAQQTDSAESKGFTFKYFYNGDSDTKYDIPDVETGEDKSYITVAKNKDYTTITIYMYINIDGTPVFIDSETIPYVKEGAPGVGIAAVNYSVNVTASSATKYSKATDAGFIVAGYTYFQLTRAQGLDAPELIDNSSISDYILTAYSNGKEVTPTYDTTNARWRIVSAVSEDNYSSASNYVQILLYSKVNTLLASQTVPYIMEGEKGDVQALNGVVMRFRSYGGLADDGFGNICIGTVSSDGVKYKDIILYESDYYYVAPTYAGGLDPTNSEHMTALGLPCNNKSEVGEHWVRFNQLGDAAFQAVIAKYAFIENLTGREIVITDTLENKQVPVAGLTNGTAVEGDGDALVTADGGVVDRGNVRIWAGYDNTTSDLLNSKFYVTSTGFLHAENADITGKITASSGSIGGFTVAENGYDLMGYNSALTLTGNSSSWDYNLSVLGSSRFGGIIIDEGNYISSTKDYENQKSFIVASGGSIILPAWPNSGMVFFIKFMANTNVTPASGCYIVTSTETELRNDTISRNTIAAMYIKGTGYKDGELKECWYEFYCG